MLKTGWWSVDFEITLEGDGLPFEDLDEATQEHIIRCIQQGYTNGELITEKIEEVEKADPLPLLVCEQCLAAIQSREGFMPTIIHCISEDDNESHCTWCGKNDDVLYEIL